MNCAGARKLFGAYWDDEITLAERDWLESHFAGCTACRSEYESFARAIELVGSLPRVEVKPDLAERALARARRVAAVPDRLPLGAPRWIPVTATAALLIIAATTALQWLGVTPGGRSPDPSAVATAPELVRQPELTGRVQAPAVVAPVGDRRVEPRDAEGTVASAS
ncbi:MAG TPA: zf-HC2 domain-containing protein, partial [Candidatus Eisenbacteria bacterium]|nr:zf-HC2 domain-containing protein [Candidatus Eisenbacteria bacterium]